MATLKKIGELRPKKLPPVKIPTEQVPMGLTAYIQTDYHALAEKAITKAIEDEVKAVKKKIIRRNIAKQGYLKTFSELLGCPPGSAHYTMFQELDDLEEEDEWGKLSGQETVALFVTLSPEPGTASPEQLLDAMSKIAKKKGVSLMLWSVENYGVKSEHPHTHAIIVLDKSTPSGERGKMKATVTRICQPFKTKSEAYLQIKAVSTKNVNKKIDYVKGNKYDADKKDKVEQDKLWRKELGLQDWYIYPDNRPDHDQD